MWTRQDLHPHLWLLAPALTTCTGHSTLSVPQTVAECVLYYYLTKKNENYKSLVRRSYRRRGKSQVRGGPGGWLSAPVPGMLRGWLHASFVAVCTVGGDHLRVLLCGRPPRLGPPQWWLEDPFWGVQTTLAAERSTRRKTTSILSLENSRTPGLVSHDPCGEGVTSPEQGLGSLHDLDWLTSLTF